MPMARALELAPDAVVVPPRREAYEEASARVFAILHTVTPLVEPLSLDEAFLDVTASASLFGSASEIATQLRQRIADEIALPASAGIAAVKFIAKIASDYAKPNGQRLVDADAGAAFLAPLPVGRLWGVGPKLEARLRAMEIATIGDLARRGAERLEQRLGPAGRELWELSQGIDPRPVVPDREAKSIGAEETFEEDLNTPAELQPHIHAQALRVGRAPAPRGPARALRAAEIEARGFQAGHAAHDVRGRNRRRAGAVPRGGRAAARASAGDAGAPDGRVGAKPRGRRRDADGFVRGGADGGRPDQPSARQDHGEVRQRRADDGGSGRGRKSRCKSGCKVGCQVGSKVGCKSGKTCAGKGASAVAPPAPATRSAPPRTASGRRSIGRWR